MMKVNITLRHGPLDFEIEAEDDEDYRNEILALAEFFSEHEEEFEAFDIPESEKATSGSEDAPTSEGEDLNPSENGAVETDGALGPVASELRISSRVLEEFLDVDPAGETHPVIFMEDSNILGETRKDQQRAAALILLYLWKKCYDKERPASSALYEALEDSGISSDNAGKIYQDEGKRYFDPKGRGPTATVKLRRPGEREAKKEIKELADKLALA